ncbi:Branched-chain amino acid ABC transporter, amino acid-binding protein [Minicystis rosea]|nr:Branched-chain amino acid ABC transporter, amino acid-binding protein [Minicystis rosea]
MRSFSLSESKHAAFITLEGSNHVRRAFQARALNARRCQAAPACRGGAGGEGMEMIERRRRMLGVLGLVGLGAIGLGCGRSREAAKEWRVGAYLSLSGPETQYGIDTKEGMELAVAQVNGTGGVKGKPLKILYEDDKSSPQEASNKVLQLIDRDKVVAVLGEIASSRSKVGGIVANRRRVPMITPFATNPDVTRIGPFVFRVCFTDDAQGRAAAHFVADTLKKKRVAILFAADDLYSSGLAAELRDEARRIGLEIVAEKQFLKGETNFTTYISELAAASPDIIYAPLYYNSMIPIARQAAAAGVRGDIFLGGDGWDAEALLKDAGVELNGAYFTNHFAPDVPSSSSQAFVNAYRERYKHAPSSLAALGYDATLVLADAIGRAKGDTPQAIRDAIAETKGFQGATGATTINAERNADKAIVIVQIKDRKLTYHSTIAAKKP